MPNDYYISVHISPFCTLYGLYPSLDSSSGLGTPLYCCTTVYLISWYARNITGLFRLSMNNEEIVSLPCLGTTAPETGGSTVLTTDRPEWYHRRWKVEEIPHHMSIILQQQQCLKLHGHIAGENILVGMRTKIYLVYFMLCKHTVSRGIHCCWVHRGF